jgi:hypothetical protein
LEDNFRPENGYKVLEVPVTLDSEFNVIAKDFVIQKLDDRGIPVEVRRVDPFGAMNALNQGGREFLQRFAENLMSDDPEQKKDLMQTLGNIANIKVATEAGAYGLTAQLMANRSGPARIFLSLPALAAGGITGNALGQLITNFANDLEYGPGTVDTTEALMVGLFGMAGYALPDLISPGKGARRALLSSSKGAAQDRLRAAAAFDAPVNLLDVVSSKPFKKIALQAAALRPDKYTDITKQQSVAITDKIRQKIKDFTQEGGSITPDEIISYLTAERAKLFDEIDDVVKYNVNSLEDPVVSIAIPQTRLAARRFNDAVTNVKEVRNALYQAALKADPDFEINIADDLEILRGRLREADLAVPAVFKKQGDPEGTGVFQPDGTEVLKEPGTLLRSSQGEMPAELKSIVQEILQLDPDIKATTIPGSPEKFPVLEQLYNLERRFSTALYHLGKQDEYKATGLLNRMAPVESAIKSMIENVIAKSPTQGGIRDLMTQAHATQRFISDLPKINYFADALMVGDANAYDILVENLVSGKTTITGGTRGLLNDIANVIALKNKTTQGVARIPANQAVQNFEDFAKGIGQAAYVNLTSDPSDYLTKLANIANTGKIESYADVAQLSKNYNMKFLFDKETIKLLQKQGYQKLDVDNDLATRALSGITMESSTNDIIDSIEKQLRNFPFDAGQKQLNQFLENFKGTEPQIRTFLFDRLLKRNSLPDGTIDFAKMQKDVDRMTVSAAGEDQTLRRLYQFAFDENKAPGSTALIQNLRTISEALVKSGPDDGAGFQVGEETAKIAKGSIFTSTRNLLSFLRSMLTSGAIASFASKPVSAQQLAKIIKFDQPLFMDKKLNKAKAIDLTIRQLSSLLARQFYTNEDLDFYTQGPDGLSKLQKVSTYMNRADRNILNREAKKRAEKAAAEKGLMERGFEFIDSMVDQEADLKGDEGEDRITGSNINLPPSVPSAPIPPTPTGLNISTPTPTAGRGIAALPAPETTRQLAEVGLPLFGGTRG